MKNLFCGNASQTRKAASSKITTRYICKFKMISRWLCDSPHFQDHQTALQQSRRFHQEDSSLPLQRFATATSTALYLQVASEGMLSSSAARQHNKYLSLSVPLLFCFLLFLLHPHPSIHQQHIPHLYQSPPHLHIQPNRSPAHTATMHHTLGLVALAAMAQAFCPTKPLW